MFYMKSDNIEDLFREAAEKYHIDTEAAAAWNDVYDAVHAEDEPAPPTPPGGNGKKRWLNIGWLLLVPLGWFAHNVWNNISDSKTAQKTEAIASAASDKKNGINNGQKAAVSAGAKDTKTAEIEIKPNEKPIDKNTGSYSPKTDKAVAILLKQPAAAGRISSKKITGVVTSAGRIGEVNDVTTGKNPALVNSGASKEIIPQSSVTAGNKAEATGIPGAPRTEDNPSVSNSTVKTQEPLPAALGSDDKNGKNSNGKKDLNEHYFYGAFVVAPDVSFIHFQKASSAGIGGGILLGYHFNKRLSLETGVLFDKKNYYTKGKFFDGKNVPFIINNPDITLNKVSGDCNMFEIPVNLKYTFIAKNKNSLYGIAGISSYLMGHEFYNFDYNWWGSEYTRGYPYNNKPQNWFSIVNLSVGYERKLNLKTSLRVEPYIKVPVSGVGTGNLAITSTGLYIGLTRRIP